MLRKPETLRLIPGGVMTVKCDAPVDGPRPAADVLPDGPEPTLASHLIALGSKVAAGVVSRVSALGVAMIDVDILHVVVRSEGVSQRRTAAALGLFPTPVGVRIAELCERGLLVRRVDGRGRRGYRLFVTAAGRRCLHDVERAQAAYQADLLAGLGPNEQRLLERLVGGLARRVDREAVGEGPAERVPVTFA